MNIILGELIKINKNRNEEYLRKNNKNSNNKQKKKGIKKP